jgi:DNA-binding CsgD family transcriptional regulator
MFKVSCPVVVGRGPEFEALSRLTREGGAAVVVGEPGIGKSRLVRAVAEQAAAAGSRVLVGRGVQSHTTVAYRAVAEALVSTLRSTGVPEAPELRPYLPALGLVAPELARPDDPHLTPSGIFVGEAVVRLLAAFRGGAGSVLVLEDLQWADADTVEVVRYVADNSAGERITLLATARPEPGRGWSLVRELEDRRAAAVLRLAPLNDTDVAAMAAACLRTGGVPQEVTAALAASSGGVPFVVEELLAAWIHLGQLRDRGGWVAEGLATTVPASVEETVRDRVGKLGEIGQQVVEAAAVLGRRFPWQLLPELAGVGQADVLSALRSAVDVHLLESDDAGFRFRHALTREAVLAGVLRPQQAALSRRGLELLLGPDEPPEEAAALAAELAVSVDDTHQACRLLLGIGRRAVRRGALRTAEDVLRRADALGEGGSTRVEVEEALVETLTLAGKTDLALSVGSRLLDRLASSVELAVDPVDVHIRLARAAATAARWESAAEQLAPARALASGNPASAAAVDAVAAHVSEGLGRIAEAESLARSALAAAEAVDLPEIACEALEVLGRCARHADLERAEQAFRRAAETAERHALTVWRTRALHELGTVDLLRHGGTRLDRLLDARSAAADSGVLATAATVDLQLAAGLITCFRHVEALEAARRGGSLARQLGLVLVEAMGSAFEAAVHGQAGDEHDLEQASRRALALAPGHPDVEMVVHGQARAMSALLGGNRRRALTELEWATAAARRTNAPTPAPFRGLWALLVEVEHGDGEEASAEVRDTGGGVHVVIGANLLYSEAVRLGRAGRRDEASATVRRADATLRELPWHLHLGRFIVAEPALAMSWGEPEAWLVAALAFFGRHGADRLTSRCRSLLRQAGIPVPRGHPDAATVPAPLRALGITVREAEVLSLLVDGLGNREIAARLFLSPRTVERHLANLSRKAGTSNRTQLAAFAVRIGGPLP